MTESTLYDDDILLWSEQQAAAIRKLARVANGLPNELDIENVAEEIESVGRSELASVESLMRHIMLHLMKLLAEEDALPERHWRAEIFAFHSAMMRRYAPSMRNRISLDVLWGEAREELLLSYEGRPHDAISALPLTSILTVDELLRSRIDAVALLQKMRSAISR